MTVDLRLGDCLEILPTLGAGSVDAVITDPPYCSGGFSEQARKQATYQGLRSETAREVGWFINDNMGTAGIVWLMRAVAAQSFRLIKDGGSFCVFTDWRMVVNLGPALESVGFRWQNMAIWDKGNPGLGWGFRPQYEVVLHYVKGTGKYYRQDIGNILKATRVSASDKSHQTEKPVSLLEQIVTLVSPIGGTVGDWFFGSGTTGVACVKTGRNFIGCEISSDYHAIAEKRIREAQLQMTMPLEVLA